MLASSGKDGTICIYDTKTYKVMYRLDEDQGSGVVHVAWSPDDTKIVTCCIHSENSARIWDVKVCQSSTPGTYSNAPRPAHA
jgi:WD40 repeat protein